MLNTARTLWMAKLSVSNFKMLTSSDKIWGVKLLRLIDWRLGRKMMNDHIGRVLALINFWVIKLSGREHVLMLKDTTTTLRNLNIAIFRIVERPSEKRNPFITLFLFIFLFFIYWWKVLIKIAEMITIITHLNSWYLKKISLSSYVFVCHNHLKVKRLDIIIHRQ